MTDTPTAPASPAPADVALAISIADSVCNEYLPNGGPLPLRDALAKRITAALSDQRAAAIKRANEQVKP